MAASVPARRNSPRYSRRNRDSRLLLLWFQSASKESVLLYTLGRQGSVGCLNSLFIHAKPSPRKSPSRHHERTISCQHHLTPGPPIDERAPADGGSRSPHGI